MSRTARSLARLGAGFAVAATAATLAAAPAQAATPVVAYKPFGTVMRVTGSDVGESIVLTIFNGALTVSNTLGTVQAGPGCIQLGAAVRCDGVTAVGWNGNGGDDTFRNDTSLTVSGNGGPGSDRYTGGPGKDRFRGGDGVDFVNGGNGQDHCEAENESGCELDFPPPPKVRVPS